MAGFISPHPSQTFDTTVINQVYGHFWWVGWKNIQWLIYLRITIQLQGISILSFQRYLVYCSRYWNVEMNNLSNCNKCSIEMFRTSPKVWKLTEKPWKKLKLTIQKDTFCHLPFPSVDADFSLSYYRIWSYESSCRSDLSSYFLA